MQQRTSTNIHTVYKHLTLEKAQISINIKWIANCGVLKQ